jgi:two-component system NtrC family sensor kinase
MLTMLSFYAAAAIENARMFDRVKAEGRKLEAVIRGTEQPVIITDMESRVLLMNRAAHQAFSTRQVRGTGMLLPRAIDHPALTSLFNQAQSSGRVEYGEIAVEKGQTYRTTVTPIQDIGLVTVMQDITDIKELSQLKSEFVSTVSHDLRSPLSTVLGILDILDQAGPLNETQLDFIQGARQEVARLIDLTRDLLDLGRLEAGMELTMKRCDLRDIVTQSIEAWQSQAKKRQHILEARLPPGATFVHGNTGRLRQLLDNLIGNAIKYTPSGGRVRVRLTQVSDQVVLQVRDTGLGISPEDQPYIFDRFFRVQNEQTEDIQGTGLGLAIVKSIVERHNGRIWLESELGEGSTFEVVMPGYKA